MVLINGTKNEWKWAFNERGLHFVSRYAIHTYVIEQIRKELRNIESCPEAWRLRLRLGIVW